MFTFSFNTLSDDEHILINDIDINQYNQYSLHEKIIYINSSTKIPIDLIFMNCKNDHTLFVNIIKDLKLNLSSSIEDIHQQQLINFLYVCLSKNKIIYLDNAFNTLKDNEKKYVLSKIKIIKNTNFIISNN